MNGLRQVDVSLSIGSGSLIQIDTDKFGQNQVLVGVLPISGGDLQFVEIRAEQWGNRKVIVPAYHDPTASGAQGMWRPPLYTEVIANSSVTILAFQDSGGAQVQRVILFFQIASPGGGYPANIMRHMGELHTQFISGTAGSGSFISAGEQDVLNEEPNDMWMPVMMASVGDSPGQVKYSHPFDEGFPPMSINAADVLLGLDTFENIPPSNPLHGADTITFLAQDDSGSAVRAYLYTGRVTGGKTVLSNRSPFGT